MQHYTSAVYAIASLCMSQFSHQNDYIYHHITMPHESIWLVFLSQKIFVKFQWGTLNTGTKYMIYGFQEITHYIRKWYKMDAQFLFLWRTNRKLCAWWHCWWPQVTLSPHFLRLGLPSHIWNAEAGIIKYRTYAGHTKHSQCDVTHFQEHQSYLWKG